ncbi:MAG: hypothetical protein WCK37_01740 [Candidatus Falkowbacteria bacterium]
MLKYLKRRHEKHYKGKPFHLFADIFFVLTIITLLITFFVIKNWQPKATVSVSISGPSKISSGTTNDFTFKYQANQDTKNNVLNLNLPNNFTITGVEPTSTYDIKTNSLTIGDLKQGQSGEFKIHSIISGAINHDAQLFSSLTCDQCGTGILSYFDYNINDSALSIETELPDKIYNNIEFSGKLKVKNNGATTTDEIKLVIDKQLQFRGLESGVNDNTLIIKNLAPGQTKDINFTAISSSGVGLKNITISTYLIIDGEELKQLDKLVALNVGESNFKLSITPDKNTARGGESINYLINFQNKEASQLSNIKFSLFSGHNDFEISSIKLLDFDKKTTLSDKIINITDSLNPGESGKINITVNYKRLKTDSEVELPLDVLVQYKISEQTLKYHLISDKTKILSSLKASAMVRYYSQQGDQLGVGPVPPMVDMATKYWVFLEINNKGNDLDNITVSADVPSAAIWTDNKSLLSGGLNYNSNTGHALWQMDEISKDGNGVYRVAFELGVIPEISDIGKTISLLNNIRYTAHDKFCDQTISGNLNDLDTKITDSHFGANNGLVVANEQ